LIVSLCVEVNVAEATDGFAKEGKSRSSRSAEERRALNHGNQDGLMQGFEEGFRRDNLVPKQDAGEPSALPEDRHQPLQAGVANLT
jgi:hypothetical protein